MYVNTTHTFSWSEIPMRILHVGSKRELKPQCLGGHVEFCSCQWPHSFHRKMVLNRREWSWCQQEKQRQTWGDKAQAAFGGLVSIAPDPECSSICLVIQLPEPIYYFFPRPIFIEILLFIKKCWYHENLCLEKSKNLICVQWVDENRENGREEIVTGS